MSFELAPGERLQVQVPYSDHGSRLRIKLKSIPLEPRLVVNGVSMGKLTLELPDGSRIERDKTRPSSELEGSPVAAVFALAPPLVPGTEVTLHSADTHRNVLDLRLMPAAEWREQERFTVAFAVSMYGAFLAFVVIAATYRVILRERMFGDHALYLAALVVFMAMSSGLFYAAFPGGVWSRLGVHAQWAFGTAAIGFAVGFVTRFLDLSRYFPRSARALEVVRLLLLALAAGILVWPTPMPKFGALVALALVVINLVLVGFGVALALRRQGRYGWYFLAGWVPLTICTSVRALQGTGLVEIRYELSFFYALGAAWEAIVLTAGIADRALGFRRERDIARHLAEHDGLTGVLNRRALEARLDEAARNPPFAVLFLDLDHFKSINDRHGHASGDAVLVAVVRRVAAELRGADVLGRWGGEELVALLRGASPEAARITAERVRRVVEADPVHVEGTLVPVTVSVGLAASGALPREGADLVRRADEALYRAKSGGRNRVSEALEA